MNIKNNDKNVENLFEKKLKNLWNVRNTFHLVDPNPWSFFLGLLALEIFSLLFLSFYKQDFNYINSQYKYIFISSVVLLFSLIIISWFSDITKEGSLGGFHTNNVKQNLKLGIIFFIISEIMFFFSFFWTYFHSSLVPSIEYGSLWPMNMDQLELFDPMGIPLLNTIILLWSGFIITSAHHALINRNFTKFKNGLFFCCLLGILFLFLQNVEYLISSFTMSDGIFGSIFYLATGFHGFHVLIGMLGLTWIFTRTFQTKIIRYLNIITNTSHTGTQGVIWYWHFVDVVWVFLFVVIYILPFKMITNLLDTGVSSINEQPELNYTSKNNMDSALPILNKAIDKNNISLKTDIQQTPIISKTFLNIFEKFPHIVKTTDLVFYTKTFSWGFFYIYVNDRFPDAVTSYTWDYDGNDDVNNIEFDRRRNNRLNNRLNNPELLVTDFVEGIRSIDDLIANIENIENDGNSNIINHQDIAPTPLTSDNVRPLNNNTILSATSNYQIINSPISTSPFSAPGSSNSIISYGSTFESSAPLSAPGSIDSIRSAGSSNDLDAPLSAPGSSDSFSENTQILAIKERVAKINNLKEESETFKINLAYIDTKQNPELLSARLLQQRRSLIESAAIKDAEAKILIDSLSNVDLTNLNIKIKNIENYSLKANTKKEILELANKFAAGEARPKTSQGKNIWPFGGVSRDPSKPIPEPVISLQHALRIQDKSLTIKKY